MTNKKLRNDLLTKLAVTPQALSQQVQRLKKQHPMTTEDATYVIAHRNRLKIDRYLPQEVVDRVRGILRDIAPEPAAAARQRRTKRASRANAVRTVTIGQEFGLDDPVISDEKLTEAAEMSKIYPLLYVLENSLRDFLDRVMTHLHGADWFDSEAPKGLRESVESRRGEDKKNAWHQRRGGRPIDYLDFKQLRPLAKKIESELVPKFIPSIAWLEQLIEEVYLSRCVVCHMNPLNKDNIQALKVRFKQWQKQMKGKKELLP